MSNRLPQAPRFQRLLQDSLLGAAYSSADRLALITHKGGLTYRQLFLHVQQFASVLLSLGLQRGDRVIIYADNSPEAVIALWGTLWAGGIFVLVNPQTKADKLKYLVDKSSAKVLVSDEHLKTEFQDILPECKSLAAVLCSNLSVRPEHAHRQLHIKSFWDEINAAQPLVAGAPGIPLDVAAIIFTSGSTGFPKGVTMTHQAMVFARDSIIEYLRLGPAEKILNVLPLAFDYGLYQLLMATALGCTLILERSFAYPGAVYAKILKENITVFPGVPTVFSTLLSMHKTAPLCFPSVLRVTNTAAALPPDYVPLLKQVFPNALIFAMYGLTECKRVSFLAPEFLETKPGSVGKAIPGTEMFLLSPDGGAVGPKQAGILHIRGPHIMSGYWEDPEQTAKMLKPGPVPGERVLCAQDWFVMDEEGFFYFQGRSDDIIKTRGEKVSPVEVENVLHSLAGVKEAAVIGIPDENLGQAIKAFVVLEQGNSLTPSAIKRHCAERLESFMVPQIVELVETLAKTANGKIKKDGLR
ncbi:MAG TPA: AMP-binding protein [Verrucomicrobiae bacterium]|nr:AMP-binding protein [Verrucomicrobiae bacterium]